MNVGGIVALVLILGGVGFCVSKINQSVSDSKNERQRQAALVATGPALSVTASKLVADYLANEVAADATYKGKVVAVTGVVVTIGKDIADDPYVTLDAGDDLRDVQCAFEHAGSLVNLRAGQIATIRGVVDGMLGNVHVKDSLLQ